MRTYYVYLLASHSRRLYVGVTSNLDRRLAQHRAEMSVFTAAYRVTKLVHYETTSDVWSALAREKEIKGWRRAKKIALIERSNAGWLDLSP